MKPFSTSTSKNEQQGRDARIDQASTEECIMKQTQLASGRRGFLAATLSFIAFSRLTSVTALAQRGGGALTKVERDRMTPAQIIEDLKKGNERFRTGQMIPHDYRDQQRTSVSGQYPAAVVLGCIDSRAPGEIIFDTGIGETFNARIAGNVVNDDLLGSIEFACAVAGAKVVLLFGHTACGAIKGAIDDVEMGNLTGLLARIKPSISQTTFTGDKSSKNAAYVDAVARTNVRLGVENIRRRSPILEDLEKKRTIQLVGAMYDLASGSVEFVS
jgi:carbonic anhydrase